MIYMLIKKNASNYLINYILNFKLGSILSASDHLNYDKKINKKIVLWNKLTKKQN